ncbi:sialic acid-binding Ig-like lectin 10 [Sparus aurata]|uniref:sialic acid-binding Ig-like lectin 10 n=1 Tax=Sparus aurata TaxID=8175 RepID=UPI0011C18C3D|nr:sialic acid-binding Ig-like lectin 10 [Sparus aurata]
MFFLLWVALLFSVSGSSADTGGSEKRQTHCYHGFCIILYEAEITAEAGLCVVIPCSFNTSSGFTTEHMVWYKCERKRRCGDSDVIFHTNKNNKKVRPQFEGRVSLLQPDVSQNNCSIIINDLTVSDSGSYQLRVNGFRYKESGGSWNEVPEGFTFSLRPTVSVKDLIQKPTVLIPPLTEGQQTTLTCTAPGLCSGSDPTITWRWKGTEVNNSHITGNITAQNHSSTLTFNPSAELHGTNVTCKVSFTGDTTTEETVTLNVTYSKEIKVTGHTSVMEGETLNLTCSVESFPPSLITWTKLSEKNLQNGTEINMQNETLSDLQNDTETYLQADRGMSTFSIYNMTVEDSGEYICTAKHLNNTLMKRVDVTVKYMKKPVITGNTTVEVGRALNLTCSVESFPPSHITWTKLGSTTDLHNEPNTDLQDDAGSATLVIHSVTAEHSGQYICTAKHLETTVTVFADVTVMSFPKISNFECKIQTEVLTCVCISDGLPVPTIKWPLLRNYTDYTVINTVSNHTVNCTVTLTVKDHSNTAAECVSSNANGEVKKNLTIQKVETKPEPEEWFEDLFKTVSWLQLILAFLVGVFLSAVICCLAMKCRRRKQNKSSGKRDETLEMVTSQEDPLIDASHAETEKGEAVAAENAAPDLNVGPKDVEYASIDFSVLKRKSPRKTHETTETEYAEIMKKAKEEKEDNGGEEGEALEGKEEEEVIGEDGETKHSVPEEEEGEEVAVYSNVKDIMAEN